MKIKLPFKSKHQVLAVGGHLKNTVCAIRGNLAYISQASGNLEELDNLKRFEAAMTRFRKRFKPKIFACDLHPEYLSTKSIKNYTLYAIRYTLFPIQHHHAHIAACMADNGVGRQKKVIGVALDGTGLGSDGNLWGSEFFVADYEDARRIAHLEYVPMPGGELAVRQPWRMAFSYIYAAIAPNAAKAQNFEELEFIKRVGRRRLEVLKNMLACSFNCPLTCGMGRLFDAVSVILGLCFDTKYEAEAAIKLEKIADKGHRGEYKFDLDGENIRIGRILKNIVKDKTNKVPKEIISAKFHNTIARVILDVSRKIRKKSGIKTVALSGGVFQNKFLTERAVDLLQDKGFKALQHRQVPCNDAGISLGQAVVATNKG